MRSIAKLAMVATFITLCTYTQFTEAQPQTKVSLYPKGKLVLNTNLIANARKQPIQLTAGSIQLTDPCCVKRPQCCIQISRVSRGRVFVDNIEGIKNIVDLGILVDLPSHLSIVLEEASIEIYSKEDKLIFSTEAKCDGCGKKLSLKTIGNSTGVLLALDSVAVSAAQPHYVNGNKLVVRFKTKGIDTVYLVNKKASL